MKPPRPRSRHQSWHWDLLGLVPYVATCRFRVAVKVATAIDIAGFEKCVENG